LQRVEHIEPSAVDEGGLPDLDRMKIKELHEVGYRHVAQGRILAQEAHHDRFGGIDGDPLLFEYLLEGAGVMVGVAVGENYAVGELRVHVGIKEPFGGVDRRIDHNAAVVQPDDEAGGVIIRVKAVAWPQAGDAEKRRPVRLGEPFADEIGRLVLHAAGHRGYEGIALPDQEAVVFTEINGDSLHREPVTVKNLERYQIRELQISPEKIHLLFDMGDKGGAYRRIIIIRNVKFYGSEQG